VLPDTPDEDGGDTLGGDVIETRCCGGAGIELVVVYSAVISVIAARAEDSSTIAFLVA
jgi:hypothetical protein